MNIKRRAFLLKSGLAAITLFVAQFITDRLGFPLPFWSDLPEIGLDPALARLPDPAGLILRFAITADTGMGDRYQYAVAQAMTRYYQEHPFPLVVLAGDNIYPDGEMWKISRVFERPYQSLLKAGVTFRACLGNHDIRSENGNSQVKYANFNMLDRYYTFQEKSVQFFVLDTNLNTNWETQLAWLERELNQSKARWKIVYGHFPIYSTGRYGSSPQLIKLLTPVFEKHKVALYINGHEHNYQRTHPIRATTYLISGNGGAALYPVQPAEWIAYAEARFGFTAVEVYRDRLEIQAIGTDGTVFDHGKVSLT